MTARATNSVADEEFEDANQANARTSRRRIEKSEQAFRTIGEAAEELGLKTHVLRFWETKFADLKPMKRKDGRRFYRPEDMIILRVLQSLLHEQGMTIKGAQRLLKERKPEDLLNATTNSEFSMSETVSVAGRSVRDLQEAVQTAVESGAFRDVESLPAQGAPQERLNRLLDDLVDLKGRLDTVRKAG